MSEKRIINGFPYYKAYPRDFIEATIGWSLELKGAYRLVLDLIYMQGGRLPDDPRYISGQIGCSVKKWNSLRLQLIDKGRIYVVGEFLANNRADKELEMLRKYSEKQTENARGPRKNNDLEKPRQSHTESESDKKEEGRRRSAREAENRGPVEDADTGQPPDIPKPEEPPPPALVPEGELPPDLRGRILTAIGVDSASGLSHGQGTMSLGDRADMDMVLRLWMGKHQLSPDEIVRVIENVMPTKRDGPPSKLTYFSAAMRRFAETRDAETTPDRTKKNELHQKPTYDQRRDAAARDAERNRFEAAARNRGPSSKNISFG